MAPVHRGIKRCERQSCGRYSEVLRPYRRARRLGRTTILAPFSAPPEVGVFGVKRPRAGGTGRQYAAENNRYVEKETPRHSRFIGNSSPLGNKAGMTEAERGAKQHGRASALCRETPPGRIARHLELVYGAPVKVCASVCASEKGKPVVRRGRKAQGPLVRR
jgi:hypothetical protein